MNTLRRRVMVLGGSAGEDYVDLGLPSGLLWAKGNICKDGLGRYYIGDETDYGCFFSWGNVVGHNEGEGYSFSVSNYDGTPGKNLTANIAVGDTYDAARACLGTPWRMPTKENLQELYDNTDREWTTINGVNGWKFMKKTDHSVFVFFAAAGGLYGMSLNNRGSYGYYWSSSYYDSSNVYRMYFSSSYVHPQDYRGRHYGFSVRAVQ